MLLLGGCEPGAEPGAYQGYVEAELVDIAAPSAGRLENLAVLRGQRVAAGAPLFRLEDTAERAALAQAEARLSAARAQVENLLAGRREPELKALSAQAASARAELELSRLQLQQAERLHASGFVSRAALDEALARHAQDRASLREAEARIAEASAAIGRSAEIEAAQAEAQAARAEVLRREWQLDQTHRSAPLDALVYETYYNPAEWVATGAPIVSLLPPAHLKLRFFVPEPALASIAVGMRVQATCSGCLRPIDAVVSYVSPRPEYTPPIIYSRETRSKLVFLVEAKPDAASVEGLNPGQPVDVRPVEAAPDAS